VIDAEDQEFIDGWRARWRREAEVARAWRAERLQEAHRAAEGLVARYAVRRVVLFGSLARGDARPGSDVDLWVEGLAESDWLDAVAAARAEIRGAEVDLVRAEWAGAAIAGRVDAEGLVLRAE